MTDPKQATILVAGAGIGGLATALGLARSHYKIVVLEKAPQLGEIGAGIQIAPNGFRCFDILGIGEEVRAVSVQIEKLRLMDAVDGREITHVDLGEPFRKRFGAPYAVVHRGDLHGALLKACRAHSQIELRPNSEVLGYEQDERSVTARISDGSTVTGAALIGADGLRSRTREQMLCDGPPRVSGHTTYRSVIPIERMPEDLRWNAATLWAGPKCHIVHYPLSGWRLFNFVATCHNQAPQPVAGKPVSFEEVMEGFRHLHPKPQEVIRHGVDWKLWVLCDREPNERWTDGRVALLGDAAHPMLQYFAQGACMALEDAVCVAGTLLESPEDVPAALERYRVRRYLRTTRVQVQSIAIGEHIYHPAGAHAQLRNAIMSARSSEDYYEVLAWLYGSSESCGAPLPNALVSRHNPMGHTT
jgi:2-polyprenyl-6-methoxyphenol hydroxylase-like FAD-dependent oxidoreductase